MLFSYFQKFEHQDPPNLYTIKMQIHLSGKNWYMSRFPEPQYFFAASQRIGIYDPPKRVLDILFYKQFHTYFQNIGLAAPGCVAFKFLPPLWSILNCCKLAIYERPFRVSTFR